MGGILSRRKKLDPARPRPRGRQTGLYTNPAEAADDCPGPGPRLDPQEEARPSPDRQPKITNDRSLLDSPNFDFRFHPMERQGTRMSETHYFLVEEPRHRIYHSTKERGNPIETYANSSWLFNQYKEEPPLPFEMNRHILQSPGPEAPCQSLSKGRQPTSPQSLRRSPQSSTSSASPAKNQGPLTTQLPTHYSLPVRRGRSDNADYLYNQHRALIARMRINIPEATETESHGVLMGTNWNFPEAERRLKMELVHRRNRANYKQCESILVEHDWNLEAALKSLERW